MATPNSSGGKMFTSPDYHNNYHNNYRQHSVPYKYNNYNNMHNNNHSNHTPQNTNPDSIQQLPSLLQLSQVDTSFTPNDIQAQVNLNNAQKTRKNKRKPKKNAPKKALPSKPLPILPVSQPINSHQRQRSKSDIIETHVLGAIKLSHDSYSNNNTKQISFTPQPYNNNYNNNNYNNNYNNNNYNNNYNNNHYNNVHSNHYNNNHGNTNHTNHPNPPNTRSHAYTVHTTQSHTPIPQSQTHTHFPPQPQRSRGRERRIDKRNLINIHPQQIRSKTPDPPKRNHKYPQYPQYQNTAVITPSPTHSLSGDERLINTINRLNKNYSHNSNEEDSTDSDSYSQSRSQSQSQSISNSKSLSSTYHKHNKKKKGFVPPQVDTNDAIADEHEVSQQNKVNFNSNKPPPATYRKKPESPRYKIEHLQRRQSKPPPHKHKPHKQHGRSKPHKPSRPPPPANHNTNFNLASASKVHTNKRNHNHNNHNHNHDNNNNRMPFGLALSKTSSSKMSLDNMCNYETKKSKKQNASSDTLSGIKKRHDKHTSIPRQANIEQLMAHSHNHNHKYQQQQKHPHQAFVDLTNRKSGSNTDLNKRIRDQRSDKPKQLPASFAKYQYVKKTSIALEHSQSMSPATSPLSHTQSSSIFNSSVTPISPLSIINNKQNIQQKQQQQQTQQTQTQTRQESPPPFIPPPPKQTAKDKTLHNQDMSMDEEDMDEEIEFVNYLNGPTHVVLNSIDSNTSNDNNNNNNNRRAAIANKSKTKHHSRGRSMSVDSPLNMSAITKRSQKSNHMYTAENIHASDETSDSDNYSFSGSDHDNTDNAADNSHKRDMIKKLKINTPQNSNPIEEIQENIPPSPATPFELVREPDEIDDEEEVAMDNDNDNNNQHQIKIVIQQEAENENNSAHLNINSKKKHKQKQKQKQKHKKKKKHKHKHKRKVSGKSSKSTKSHIHRKAAKDTRNKSQRNKPAMQRRASLDDMDDNMSVMSGATVDSDKKKKKKKWYHMFSKNNQHQNNEYDDNDDISDASNSNSNSNSNQMRPQSVRSTLTGAFTPRNWSSNKKSKKTNAFDMEFPAIKNYTSSATSIHSNQSNTTLGNDNASEAGSFGNDDQSIRTTLFDDFAVEIPLTNTEVTEKILNMKTSDWNFEHDIVNVYRAQCATLQYEQFIPKLTQIIYPSILSSLSLPANIMSHSYKVYCKYNITKLKHAAKLKQEEEIEEKADTFANTNTLYGPNNGWNNQASISTMDLNQFKSVSNEKQLHNSILFHHSNCITDNHEIRSAENQDIEMVEIEFTHSTSTQEAIKQIFNKICKKESRETKIQFQLLDLECFVLKTCGRDEYLRFNDNISIVASNYIRNCLRNDTVANSLEFVLFYVYDLNTYNEKNYKVSLKEWYRDNTYDREIYEYYAQKPLASDIISNKNKKKKNKKKKTDTSSNASNSNNNLGVIEEDKEEEIIAAKKKAKTKEKQLKFENLGYNCIVQTLIASHEKNKLTQFNLSVEKEVDWLYSTIGSILETNDTHGGHHQRNQSVSKRQNKHRSISSIHRLNSSSDMGGIGSMGSMQFTQQQQEQIEIDWENMDQSAVLLDEFEHPIEIKVKSIKNITNAPRFKLHSYDFIVLRIELMFGSNIFEECSWDIRIPNQCISNSLKIPSSTSTFSTEISELYYSMIPREAVWAFTVYGVRKNEQNKTTPGNNTKNTNKTLLTHVTQPSSYNNNNNSSSELISVSSEFRLFNKSKSSKSSRSYRGRTPTSPNSQPRTPTSPYTPRGGQLKTKSKLGVNKRYIYGDNSSNSSESSISNNTINTNGISVSLVGSNGNGSTTGDIYNDNFSDLYYDASDNITTLGDDDDKINDDDDIQYQSEPLSWCRLPVVNHRHCVNKGKFQLHLWSVPVFKYKKGGPKVDPYTTGFWKKFGTTRDRGLKKYMKSNKKSKKNKKKADWRFGTDTDIDLGKNKNDDITLNIEFPHFVFDIVAPLVNPRRPEYIARSIKPYKRKEFPGKQVLLRIIEQDGITPLDDKDKMLVYSNKEKLMRYPEAIPTFLRSVDWLDCELRMEAYDYLERWKRPLNPEDMIELLRYEFCDTRIRLYAINCLNQLDDYTLNRYLLQLVQALKNELHHNSFLSRFLMFRALRHPLQIGHYFFWHLKSEYDYSLGWCERFGVLLEEYLLHLPNNLENIGIHYGKELLYQNNLMRRLTFLSLRIQKGKKQKIPAQKLQTFLLSELSVLNQELGYKNKSLILPLNPSLRIIKLQVNKCKFMSSAKAPLWLVFTNADVYSYLYPTNITELHKDKIEKDTLNKINEYEYNKKKKKKKNKNKTKQGTATGKNYHYFEDMHDKHDIQVMYKCGDDLRQDILTLQLISVMDAFWLTKNSDLRMKPYQVIQTGNQCGMVELILNAKTTNDIHTKHGTIRGAFNNKAHLTYLKSNSNNNNILFKKLQENYARSCAGYSVATWVLGIGDRHPDNIMIHKNGEIFHIDFGHFLGNFKEKQIGGGLIKWNRERSPFVFTSLMKYAIDAGINDAQLYREFVQWIFKAYSEIRTRFKFFLNLFLLMIPSHMPELIREYDVAYLRNALRLDLNSFQDIAIHVEKTLKQCLSDKYRLVDNGIHARKHAN